MSSKTTQSSQPKEKDVTTYPVTTTIEYAKEKIHLFQLILVRRRGRQPEHWIVTNLDGPTVLSTLDFEQQTTIIDLERLEINFTPLKTGDGTPILGY